MSAKIYNRKTQKLIQYGFLVLGSWGMEHSREKGKQMLRFFISENSNS